jgi:hypothetical protein
MLALQALSLPDLINSVGKERVMVALYENWTKDTAAFGQQLSEFLGVPATSLSAKANAAQRPLSKLIPPSWVSELTDNEKSIVDRDANCQYYMDRLGYKPNSQDYSGLKTSLEELSAELAPEEKYALERLRHKQQDQLHSSWEPVDGWLPAEPYDASKDASWLSYEDPAG